MTRGLVVVASEALLIVAVAAPTFAQTAEPTLEFGRATTLSLFAGAGVDSAEAGPVAGGAIGWQVTPLIGFEGSGEWLGRGIGADGIAAFIKAQVTPVPKLRTRPTLEAGFGLYHTSFETAARSMPLFYQRRMPVTSLGPNGTMNFTDPAFVFGAGITIPVSRHISVRPEVETILAVRNGRSYALSTVSAHIAYQFEHHSVTPDRRAR